MFQENTAILFQDAEEAPEILVTDLTKLPNLEPSSDSDVDDLVSEI